MNKQLLACLLVRSVSIVGTLAYVDQMPASVQADICEDPLNTPCGPLLFPGVPGPDLPSVCACNSGGVWICEDSDECSAPTVHPDDHLNCGLDGPVPACC